MTKAIAGLMLLQGASYVILAVNHHPALVELDPLKRGGHAAKASITGGAVGCVAAAAHGGNCLAVQLLAVELVIFGNYLQLLVREQFRGELAEGGIEGFFAAASV